MQRFSVTYRNILLFLIAVLPFLIWGLQDQIDPDRKRLDDLMEAEFLPLKNAGDSLVLLYKNLHPQTEYDDSTIFTFISEPFVPTMEFRKFRHFVETFSNNKSLVISGVSGVGTTTLTSRLAMFLASNPDNILEINCAPLFDLEFHKRFVGEQIDGTFQKGELLHFFNQCRERPDEKFVLLIDDFDKINPETFFGPELWRKLNEPTFEVRFGDEIFVLPDNFYMISVTHASVGSRIELNNEHFRRLGRQKHIEPSPTELILYLRGKKTETEEEFSKGKSEVLEAEMAALNDTAHLKKFIYFFTKINELIEQKYSKSFRLGQWSNLRKMYRSNELDEVADIFLNHVNALRPNSDFRRKDLDPIFYSIRNDGKLKNSNFFARQFQTLEEKGFLTEFFVGLTFLLFSALSSWYFFRKRQRYIQKYTDKVHQLMSDFENNKTDYDDVSREFSLLKREVDTLILDKKINYTEATFFYNFIEDRIRRIEISREVNRNFEELVKVFLEDNVITKGEYRKLKAFLANIKTKISFEDYDKFKDEIERLYKQFGKK